jgi:hypothetical protein
VSVVIRIAASGTWGTVQWACDSAGRFPAREFYESLSQQDQVKVQALFSLFAGRGRISNEEKFKQLGPKAGKAARGLWEFKSFQIRFIGDFRSGYRFLVAHGLRKKSDDLSRSDIERAVRVLSEHDAQES